MKKLNLDLTSKIEPFLTSQKRIKVAFGGRGGTKSMSVADILAHEAQVKGLKIGCFREHQNTIEDSVHALIKEEIQRIGIPGFKITDRNITHNRGGGFRFRGLARNTSGVKSFHGFKRFWIEEGQFLSEESLRTIIPTLREPGSEIWITLNPQSREDPVAKRYIVPFYKELLKNGVYEDDDHYIVWVNYDENPWFPTELENDRKRDYANLSRTEYDHIWRGHFNDTVENALIKAEWFDSCIDAHKKLPWFPEPLGAVVVAHDPSDLGPDDKGLAMRQGAHLLQCMRKSTGEVDEGMDWALDFTLRNQADLFTWDCDGIGLGCKSQVKRALKGKHTDYYIYKGSEGVDRPNESFEEAGSNVTDKRKQRTNKQMIKNKRAQKYWELRNRMFNTHLAVEKNIWCDPDQMLSIHSDIEEIENLRSELGRIPRKYNPSGMIQIMTKDEMKKLPKPIASPNLGDSAKMSLVAPEIIQESAPLVFSHPWDKG